jgi:hypothetical protein
MGLVLEGCIPHILVGDEIYKMGLVVESWCSLGVGALVN